MKWVDAPESPYNREVSTFPWLALLTIRADSSSRILSMDFRISVSTWVLNAVMFV